MYFPKQGGIPKQPIQLFHYLLRCCRKKIIVITPQKVFEQQKKQVKNANLHTTLALDFINIKKRKYILEKGHVPYIRIKS